MLSQEIEIPKTNVDENEKHQIFSPSELEKACREIMALLRLRPKGITLPALVKALKNKVPYGLLLAALQYMKTKREIVMIGTRWYIGNIDSKYMQNIDKTEKQELNNVH